MFERSGRSRALLYRRRGSEAPRAALVSSISLADRALHLDLDEPVHLDRVLEREFGADPLDDLSLCLWSHNHHFPSTPYPIRPAQRAVSYDGTKNRSVPNRKSPASRTLFASVPHLARVAWRVDAVGPRPASWHTGAAHPSYSLPAAAVQLEHPRRAHAEPTTRPQRGGLAAAATSHFARRWRPPRRRYL